jgi:hypothetical protein
LDKSKYTQKKEKTLPLNFKKSCLAAAAVGQPVLLHWDKAKKRREISEHLPLKKSSKIPSNAHQYAEKSVPARPT